jgi:hypothetical protein
MMDYRDTAARIESQATADLTYANRMAGKQVVIGVLFLQSEAGKHILL